MKQIIIIGGGFSGLSAATIMAKNGWDVSVIEKHSIPGGRARQFSQDGFTFDMGPSWYWMPDVFERYFALFGKKTTDYYSLKRLDPSYHIYWELNEFKIPAAYKEIYNLFEKIESGAGKKLDKFLIEAAFKYDIGINKLVHKPGRSLMEFLDFDLLKGIFKLDVFTSIKKHVSKFFKNEELKQLLEFPILFLGALPENTPSLYSLMNYADIKLGTWYPEGGMYKVVDAMYQLASEVGVKFKFNHIVNKFSFLNNKISGITASNNGKDVNFNADVVIASADYHFIETQLLPERFRSYSKNYWDSRKMAPSCLLYFLGLNKKVTGLQHHTLFFDVDFEKHSDEIYKTPKWPEDPLFYISATSVTDASVAPAGHENVFILIPVASGLQGDTPELRDKYLNLVLDRFEKRTRQEIKNSIIYNKNFGPSDFVNDYNAFKGNAYGLANTLFQTALFKPSCKSKKLNNLYYTGQLTIPGPGVPPSIISGEVVAKQVIRSFK